MSSWTHSICQDCWNKSHPKGDQPVRVSPQTQSLTINSLQNQIQTCCWCGNTHTSGISLQCKGAHK